MKVSYRSIKYGLLLITALLFGLIVNSNIGFRVSVFVLFLGCILRGKQEETLFNPFYMFAITPLSLLLYVNISSRYMMDLSERTWLIAIINMTVFILALEFSPEKSSKTVLVFDDPSKLNRNIIALCIIGFLPSIYRYLTGSIFPLASVLTLFLPVAVVLAISTKNKFKILMVVGVYIASILTYMSKSALVSLFMIILISYEKYRLRNRKSKGGLVIFALSLFVFIIISFSFATKGREATSAQDILAYYQRYGGVQWNFNEGLFMPYMYLTTPWANLQYVMTTSHTRTFGLWLLKPFLGYLQLDSLFMNYYQLNAYSGFNTFTFIGCQYVDFGFWGSCISSFILGTFVKRVYSLFKSSASPLDTISYSLVAVAVLEMFFSNEFFSQSFPFTIVILMFLYKKYLLKTGQVKSYKSETK